MFSKLYDILDVVINTCSKSLSLIMLIAQIYNTLKIQKVN